MATDPPPAKPSFPDDPPIARVLRKIDSWVGLAEQVFLCAIGVFLMFVLVVWVLTDKFAEPIDGIEQDVLYGTYLMAMVGGAFATHHRRLLAMDLINRMVGTRARAWLRVATTAFAIFITAIFFYYTLDLYFDEAKKKSVVHWMPAIAGKGAMAFGSALILFHLTVQIIIDVAYLVTGKTPPEPEMGAV